MSPRKKKRQARRSYECQGEPMEYTFAYELHLHALLDELDKGWMGPLERIRIDQELMELTQTAKAIATELGSLMGELTGGQKEKMNHLLVSIEQVGDYATEQDDNQTEDDSDAMEGITPVT